MEDGRAHGVALADGERLFADTIVSNADPKTSFFDLVGAQHLDVQFTHRINRLRNNGQVAKLHLALDELPTFKGMEKPQGRLLLASSMGLIENAFDAAKYGDFAGEPPMEVIIPSLYDDSLAPPGKHVLSAHVQYAPYNVKGGWDARREELQEVVLDNLANYAPGIRNHINAVELLTPADLEAQFNMQGGHWHHAEFAIDSWWVQRPTYGASQYCTPVPGFYLCGAGSHPGGGIMGAAGANAANAILDN
jgi:phytoene dehydrogenase-like protein